MTYVTGWLRYFCGYRVKFRAYYYTKCWAIGRTRRLRNVYRVLAIVVVRTDYDVETRGNHKREYLFDNRTFYARKIRVSNVQRVDARIIHGLGTDGGFLIYFCNVRLKSVRTNRAVMIWGQA